MNIMERPVCIKCQETAICLISNMWLCGKCLTEVDRKLKEQRKKAIMEIIG